MWCLRKISSFWGTKKKWENKKIYHFPLHSGLGWQGLRLCFCRTPDLSHFHFLNKNNIASSRVTKKQYCKIILFYKFLSNETDIFRVLMSHTLSREIVPDNTSFSLRCKLFLNLLLTGIRANSTFRTVFNFNKLKILYCWYIIFCYDYKHLPFSNKP